MNRVLKRLSALSLCGMCWSISGSSLYAESQDLIVGEKAPSFRLRTLDGAMFRLDEHAYPGREKSYAKKRPVLLEFFRTDCAPCLRAMPDLVRMARTQETPRLEIVVIALLEEEEGEVKLRKYLKQAQLPFTVLVDATEYVAKKYLGNPITLPASFLISPDGVLLKKANGAVSNVSDYYQSVLVSLQDKP